MDGSGNSLFHTFGFDTVLDWQQHAVLALGQALPQEDWMDRMHGRFDTTDTPSSLFRSALLLCFRLHFLLTYFNTVLAVGGNVGLDTNGEPNSSESFVEQVHDVGTYGDGKN